MNYGSRLLLYCSRAAALTATAALTACAVAPPAPVDATDVPPPPPAQLTPLPPAADGARADQQPSPQSERLLFPGLDDDTDDQSLPFERGVAERRKRIDLGLESTRQADEPVNNVIDLEF